MKSHSWLIYDCRHTPKLEGIAHLLRTRIEGSEILDEQTLVLPPISTH